MLTDIAEHAIRNFKLGDRELVVEFFENMGGESRAFFNRGDGNKRGALEFFNRNGDEPGTIRFLSSVDCGGKEVMTGYVFAWDMGSKIPTLGIAVRDEYKGKGLGRRLMKHLIDYLEQNGYGGVMLTTAFANIRGQGLYTRMGFEHIGTHACGELLYLLKFKK